MAAIGIHCNTFKVGRVCDSAVGEVMGGVRIGWVGGLGRVRVRVSVRVRISTHRC